MCGLAGFSGDIEIEFLRAANRKLAHRGPDGDGILHDKTNAIGLAHRRLAIIDLSSQGAQPMWDTSRSAAIVFNGEIYNYIALRHDLESVGHMFHSQSDTEVLLNLYLRHGAEMLRKLNGIFAFAIWDARSQTIFIARDGFGVKPLYYAELSNSVLFASEIKALLEHPQVRRTLNPRAVAYHLTYLWSPAPDTILSSVRKLEPGCAMFVRYGRIIKYWRHYSLPCEQVSDISVDDAVSEVRAAVSLAVRQQMVSDVPVGTFLSGGLDSSAVTAMAREFAPDRRVQSFTIDAGNASSEGIVDDLPYAKAVARHLDIDLNIVRIGPEMARRLPQMLYYLDEPQADLAPLNGLLICELAREHGIKVLLSGAGGDDVFSGYSRHYALLQERYWAWLPIQARRSLSAAARTLPVGSPFLRRVVKAFQHADLPPEQRLVSYFFWGPSGMARELMSPDLRAMLETGEPERPLIQALQQLPPNVHPLNAMLHLEQRFFLADHNLNYTDRIGMAAGVEVRVPLLDPALATLAARLPVRFKQRGAMGKWIFKKAMEGILPDQIIHRRKTGFGVPLRSWLKGELRYLVENLLEDTAIKQRGLFSPRAVRDLIQRDAVGRIDGSYVILALMQMELWCKQFLDGQTPSLATL